MPDGEWVDWWTGEVIAGGQTVTRPAPLETLPLLVRAGALVPLLRPDVDTLSAVSGEFTEAVAVTAIEPGPLYVRTSPGPAHTFTLHDGTVVSQMLTSDGFTLERVSGERFTGDVVFEIVAMGASPASVSVSSWSWDAALGGTLTITLSPEQSSLTLVL